MELNSGNLRSRCEAVIVVLQGLMSSEVELVPGGVTGDVTGSELAEVCQQGHMSVMGHNSIPPSRISSRDPEERVAYGEPTGCRAQQQGLKQRLKLQRVVMVNGEVRNKDLEVRC